MLRPVISLVVIYSLFLVQSLSAAGSFGPGTVHDQVEQFGPGARVKVKLTSGQRVSGSIDSVRENGFSIVTNKDEGPREIGYGDVRQLKLATRRYTAHDHPDPSAARRVVMALGVGHHIVVNPSGEKAIHGNIQSIDTEGFTVVPDNAAKPVTIAYSDIRHVEQNLSLVGTIVLVVLILAAVVVITTVVATH